MKTNVRNAVLFGTIAVTCLLRIGGAQDAARQLQGKKIVLLIGIDKYESPEGRPLNGCVNDVNAVASLLPRFDGFPKVGDDTFHVLTNEEAKREAILSAFDRVVGQVESSRDLVYIHVSCHGSQTSDNDVPASGVLKKDETDGDGMDETILAYDSRSLGPDGKAIPDIVDDEIFARLLRPLLKKTKNVVAVFDSCHSGDVGRDPLLQARWVEPMDADKGAVGKEIVAPGRSGVFEEELDCVVISACESAQIAQEQAFEQRTNGLFTHYWVKRLEDLLGGDPTKPIKNEETYLSLVERVRADVLGRPGGQRPVVQGKLKNTVLFGIEQRIPRPYVLAERRGDLDATVVRLNGGTAVGFTKGSIFGLFDPSAVDFKDGANKVAEVELSEVNDLTSLARLRRDTLRAGLSGLPVGMFRAIELAHNYEGHRFPVAVVGERENGPLRDLVERLGGYKQIEVVDPIRRKTPAAITLRWLRIEGDAEDKIQLEESTRSEAGGKVRVLSGPYPVSDPAAVTKLCEAVTGWCQWNRILELDNPSADGRQSVQVEIQPKTEVAGRAPGDFFEGESAEFFLTIRADRPLYVALLNLADTGEITVIFTSTTPLRPGRQSLGVVPADALAGREVKRDWIKVFGSAEPMPFQLLTQEEVRDIRNTGLGKRALPPQSENDPLFRLLMEGTSAEKRLIGRVPRTTWVTSTLQTVTRSRGN